MKNNLLTQNLSVVGAKGELWRLLGIKQSPGTAQSGKAEGEMCTLGQEP